MSKFLGRTGKSGSTSIGNASMPITKVGAISSVNTTFTATSVVDATAWGLSTVVAGMFAKTSGGWIGLISAVNDGTDTLTVEGWINLANGAKSTEGSAKPTNGETVVIHQVFRCGSIKLKADGSSIYVQPSGADATTSSYKLAANEDIVLAPGRGSTYIDATLINAISTGTVTLYWCSESS